MIIQSTVVNHKIEYNLELLPLEYWWGGFIERNDS